MVVNTLTVMAAYKSVNVDPMNYVLPLFTLQHILHVYDNSFCLLPKEISGVLIQGERGLQMVVWFQLAFLLRWRKKKMNEKLEKK